MSPLALTPIAALTQQDLLQTSAASGTKEALLVVLASCVVGFIFLVWAAFFYTRRRRRKHRPHHRHDRTADAPTTANAKSETESESRHRRRRRRRRRDHRPRNPTLAETGGLPPIRGDGPPAGL